MNLKQKKVLWRILGTIGFVLISFIVPLTTPVKTGYFLLVYLLIGYDIVKKALKGILNKRVFDENFLMFIATIGAFLLGEYLEAVAVMLFYQIGEFFQRYAVSKSRKNIAELMDIRPDYANIEQNGKLVKVDPQTVAPDSVIVVCPGEKIPLDGVIIEGTATLNTSALTGESMPKSVTVGSSVQSGCIDLSGLLKIKTTKEFAQSTVSKILDLVENASSKKSASERFISKFARVYTPIVCCLALVLAFLPPVIAYFLNQEAQITVWIYRALTFLVISCPCALVISIPLSFFAGIGACSKAGIMIKGANYIEILSNVKTVVFDKTGTMTKGVFEVCAIHHTPLAEEKLLELATLAENYSSHPIAQSIKKAYGKNIDDRRVTDVQELTGFGVIALVDNQKIAVGNEKLMLKLGVQFKNCHSFGTIVHIAQNNEYLGHLVVADVLKENAQKAVADLKNIGITKTVMLTGDSDKVAQYIADELQVDAVFSELLPQDKVAIVEKILQEKQKVAFVGDGINDAPVIALADVGIAMGALGSDAAIESADVVLMQDDPLQIVEAVKRAKYCLRIVYENIYFAIGVKILCLILGALGLANMWLAIFADVGVMVLAVFNAMRVLYVKRV